MTHFSATEPSRDDGKLPSRIYRLDEEFLVLTSDGEWVLDYTGWFDGTVEGPEDDLDDPLYLSDEDPTLQPEDEFERPEEELADEDLDEPWLLGERDAPPSEAEMERLYNASLGADLALALHD